MQNRMKQHPLTKQQINALLDSAAVASLATLMPDGAPYVTPVHFVHEDGRLYVHGLVRGQKLDNIARDARASLCVYDMQGLLLDEGGNPCDTNTAYHSVIVMGEARVVEDDALRLRALERIVGKYTPQLSGAPLPANMVAGTAVIEITPQEITGKFYA